MNMTAKEACELLDKVDVFYGGNPSYLSRAQEAMTMAVAALRDSVPRVLTLVEAFDWFSNFDNQPVLYCEFKSDPNEWITHELLNKVAIIDGRHKWYGIWWRCWTHKPTAEQMAAVPWEVEG